MNQKKQELQSNLLADRMEEFFIGMKPYFKWFAAALVVLIAIGIAYGLRQQTAEKIAADSWSDFYFAAGRRDQLDTIYQTYPGTKGALWAKQTESDSLMARGLTSVYLDRDLSDELFSQAAKGYEEILNQTSDALLSSRATFGLAQSLDAQGKSAEALTQYKRILSIAGVYDGLAEDVKRRIEFIESSDGKSFFTWYQDNRPTAPTPVDVPGNLNSLPGMPDLEFIVPKVEPAEAVKSEVLTPPSEASVAPSDISPSTEQSSFSVPVEGAAETKVPTEPSSIQSPPTPEADATESGS